MTTPQTQPGCDACNKSVLSLLLLRPSPIAKDPRLAPIGSAAVSSADGLTDGLVPARKPTESRYVLRLLRAGYVHVYIPSPPPGMKSWLVYRVTEAANLIAQNSPLFDQMPQPPSCRREGHNLAGMKLLPIPQAHKIGSLWIAYSANLWSDKLKSQNAANPKAMQQVKLSGGGRNSFKPTAGALKAQVLECALGSFKVAAPDPKQGSVAQDQDFPFLSLASHVDNVADTLQRAAACHPKTRGLELAVVLGDPVGIATELNALRLRRNELAKADIEKPENAHPLNSSNALMGLKQVMLDANLARSYDTVSPLMHRGAFADIMRVKPNPRGWPEQTQWEPLELSRESVAKHGPGMGRVVFPDHDDRAAAWARSQTAASWAKMMGHYSEPDRVTWLQKFEARMQTTHYEPLARFEADWWAARQDILFDDYFCHHFDDQDCNDPRQLHSPGLAYTQESAQATTPAPITAGQVLEDYLAELNRSATEPTAVMLRAMVANQAELLPKLQAVTDVDPTAGLVHLHNVRNDKLYDLGAGMVLGAHAAGAPNAAQRLVVKYSWLSTGFGHALNAYAQLVAHGWVGALTRMGATGAGAAFIASAPGKKLLRRVESVQLVQRLTDLALQSLSESVVSGGRLKTPMQISKRYPIGEAMAMLSGRDGVSRAQVARASRGGFVELTLLTDNEEMRKLAGNMDEAVAQGAGRVELKAQPKAALLGTPATLGTVILSEAQFSSIWRERVKFSARAAETMSEVLRGGHAVIKSLDGRLAIGIVVINWVGLKGALADLNSADAKTVRNAWVGMTDSSASVLGGLLLMWEVAAKASIARRLGEEAARRSVGIHTVRASAAVLGVVAGLANFYGQFARAKDATEEGNHTIAWMYVGSSLAFLGTAGTSGLTLAGALADRQIAKGMASAAARRMALRFGAEGTASLLGISVSGWGLILLGAAVLFEVGVVMLTPTQFQEWMRRSYFGSGPDDKKFKPGDWAAELAALEKFLTPSDEALSVLPSERALPPAGAAGAPVSVT